jgi:hypothetical protein
MKSRKILYITAGVFNCIVGGLSVLLALLMVLLRGIIRTMFESSSEMIENMVTSLTEADSDYSYLKDLSDSEVVDFIMKIVGILSIAFLLIGALWITFGVFNILLNSRHYTLFSQKPKLKIWFVVGCWLFMGLNVANILTTIAVFKKDKDAEPQPTLYTAG